MPFHQSFNNPYCFGYLPEWKQFIEQFFHSRLQAPIQAKRPGCPSGGQASTQAVYSKSQKQLLLAEALLPVKSAGKTTRAPTKAIRKTSLRKRFRILLPPSSGKLIGTLRIKRCGCFRIIRNSNLSYSLRIDVIFG